MSNANKILISQDSGMVQIPYEDYKILMEKVQQAQRINEVKNLVIENLKTFMGGERQVREIQKKVEESPETHLEKSPVVPLSDSSSDAMEFEAVEHVAEVHEPAGDDKELVSEEFAEEGDKNIPPIKDDISIHYNKLDESGRLFSVFKQYYICLNDTCGGMVRVTMKDGVCSLWNYDEWDEFAFVDIHESHLRISIDPRYTELMQTLSFCEVPRLLSGRRDLISVQIDDLNKVMLELLVKAFEEVSLTTR